MTNISPSKLVLKNTVLTSPNTARFELPFTTKDRKFEQLHCLVPSVPSFPWGIFLFGIAGTSLKKIWYFCWQVGNKVGCKNKRVWGFYVVKKKNKNLNWEKYGLLAWILVNSIEQRLQKLCYGLASNSYLFLFSKLYLLVCRAIPDSQIYIFPNKKILLVRLAPENYSLITGNKYK